MSLELALQHLRLIAGHVAALDEYLQNCINAEQPLPRAHLALMSACVGVPEHKCGLRDEEAWQDHGTLAHPHMRVCVGCGYVEGSGADVQ